jgi:hypothetical protein
VGSLCPTFVSARLVGLAVKLTYANAFCRRFPSVLSEPLGASVTFLEATAPVKLPTRHCPSVLLRLEPKTVKGGISTMAPFLLAQEFHSLPPILHMTAHSPIPGYSKAPRGLFVLPQVARVFTGTAISPSPPLRQCPSRSTIHAGRNLPDKGLRYLRTVRVTAAVHWGFSSGLSLLTLTFQHWAGVSLYT